VGRITEQGGRAAAALLEKSTILRVYGDDDLLGDALDDKGPPTRPGRARRSALPAQGQISHTADWITDSPYSVSGRRH
jgi:hypothetical protein